jgi:hypothetical protein
VLPVSVDPRIEQDLKAREQFLTACAPPVGLQDPLHDRGGLGGTGRASSQQCAKDHAEHRDEFLQDPWLDCGPIRSQSDN